MHLHIVLGVYDEFEHLTRRKKAVFQESLSESKFPFSLLFSDCTAYRQYISFSYHSNREFQTMRLFCARPDIFPYNEPGKYGQWLFYLLAFFCHSMHIDISQLRKDDRQKTDCGNCYFAYIASAQLQK